MVDGIAGGGQGRVDAARAAAAQRLAGTARVSSARPALTAGAEATVALRIAGDGPPVDSARVAAIRAAIAAGDYPVDADRIAQRMIDLDLAPLA